MKLYNVLFFWFLCVCGVYTFFAPKFEVGKFTRSRVAKKVSNLSFLKGVRNKFIFSLPIPIPIPLLRKNVQNQLNSTSVSDWSSTTSNELSSSDVSLQSIYDLIKPKFKTYLILNKRKNLPDKSKLNQFQIYPIQIHTLESLPVQTNTFNTNDQHNASNAWLDEDSNQDDFIEQQQSTYFA